MTREQVSQKIGWLWIIWFIGLVNIVAMLPQLIQILRTHKTEGLSLTMFILFFWIQIAFSTEGFFTRNKMLMVCMGLNSVITAINIVLIVFYRYY